MEFDGLKISSKNVQKSAQEHAAKKQVNLEEGDFVVSGGEYEAEVMQSIKNRKESSVEKVIYGIYDNSDRSWTVRLNDFLIDQSKITLKNRSSALARPVGNTGDAIRGFNADFILIGCLLIPAKSFG